MDLFSIRVIDRTNRDKVIDLLDHLKVGWDSKNIGFGFTVQGFSQDDPARCVDWIEKQLPVENDWKKHLLSGVIANGQAGRGVLEDLPLREIFQYMTMIENSGKLISTALTKQGLKHKVSAALVEITPRKGLDALDDLVRRVAVAVHDVDRATAENLTFAEALVRDTAIRNPRARSRGPVDLRWEYPPPPYGGWDMIPDMEPPSQRQMNSQNTKRALAALLGFGRGPR